MYSLARDVNYIAGVNYHARLGAICDWAIIMLRLSALDGNRSLSFDYCDKSVDCEYGSICVKDAGDYVDSMGVYLTSCGFEVKKALIDTIVIGTRIE